MSHSHSSGHHHTHTDNRRLLWIAVILTAVFMLAEVVGGWMSGSLALLSDAGHMFNDAFSLGLALMAIIYSSKKANDHKTYGYKRLEILMAFANGVTLIVVALLIFKEGIVRLFQPTAVHAEAMLGIAILGLLVNLLVFGLLMRGSGDNLNMKGALLHVAGDLLGSIGAIAAALIIHWTGWLQADALVSLLIACIILKTSWHFLQETAHILMEGVPNTLKVEDLRSDLQTLRGVVDVHDLHIWSLDGNQVLLTAHVCVKEILQAPQILTAVREQLSVQWNIQHCTLEPELNHCSSDCDQTEHCV